MGEDHFFFLFQVYLPWFLGDDAEFMENVLVKYFGEVKEQLLEIGLGFQVNQKLVSGLIFKEKSIFGNDVWNVLFIRFIFAIFKKAGK